MSDEPEMNLVALQEQAEAENAERDLFAETMALMAAAATEPVPLPAIDRFEAPHGRFGPTLRGELAVAGVDTLPFVANEDHVIFGATITPEDRVRVVTVLEAHDPEASDMPLRRQVAFETAMAYGNRITAQVTNSYSDVETRSWVTQEQEARRVAAGETLPAEAMLPLLAQDKGVSLADYAASVITNADQYRQIAVAGVRLRRAAEGLLSAELDTPEKLAEAVASLLAQTQQLAVQLGLTP